MQGRQQASRMHTRTRKHTHTPSDQMPMWGHSLPLKTKVAPRRGVCVLSTSVFPGPVLI